MLKPIIYRLGQQPKLSLKRFFIGLGLFAISVACIAWGYYHQAWVQIVGLVFLAPALFFAGWGYLAATTTMLGSHRQLAGMRSTCAIVFY